MVSVSERIELLVRLVRRVRRSSAGPATGAEQRGGVDARFLRIRANVQMMLPPFLVSDQRSAIRPSAEAVKTHLKNIFTTLDVRRRWQAAELPFAGLG